MSRAVRVAGPATVRRDRRRLTRGVGAFQTRGCVFARNDASAQQPDTLGTVVSKIVVGVDGSEHSQAALQWALDEAKTRQATLEVVHAYDRVPYWQFYAEGGVMSASLSQAIEEEVATAEQASADAAQATIEAMLADLPDTEGVTVEAVTVADNNAAGALIERAADADLLVVGSRGRGGFAGLLLGSVSQQCASHARCPVVIIGERAVS